MVKNKDELSPNGGICVYKEVRMDQKFALCLMLMKVKTEHKAIFENKKGLIWT